MSNRTPIELSDGRTHLPVQAELVEGISIDDAIEADRSWRKVMNDLLDTASELGVPYDLHPEHTHWSWEAKRRYAGPNSEFYGIERDGNWQALMKLTIAIISRIEGDPPNSVIYINYIATAPWNGSRFLTQLNEAPRLRGCGLALLDAALRRSYDLRYNGRIGLHALSGAESFYREKCGMTDFGLDLNCENLRYFEMTPNQALEYARNRPV